MHGDQFLVEREPAECRDRCDQPCDRKRKHETRWKQHGNHLEDCQETDSLGHQKFDQAQELSGQHDKAERTKAETERGKEFRENVAIEQRS